MGESPQDRYASVERLYSQGQWPQVLEACAALLDDLPDEPGDPLRIRLILLQGHTELYGFGRIDAAATIYQQVLDSAPEPVLQAIAQQELEHCRQQLAEPGDPQETRVAEMPVPTRQPAATGPGLSPEFPFSPKAVGMAPALQQPSAMPWMEALGGVDPAGAFSTSVAPTTFKTPAPG